MVRLTRAVVLQGISKVTIDKRDTLEIDKEFGRITHLHLQKKHITTLDSLHLFQSLTVLYLYENQILRIEGLEKAHNLEILHLQRNRIRRIENLLACKKLRKLYIGYNEIETVEGLHTLRQLEELHVEHQRLQNGMSLSFDPKTLSTLCNALLVLNISGNNITNLEDLAGMDELHTLQASENSVTDLDSTSIVIRTLGRLRVLDLRNNPIAKKPQFKERIIGFSANIAILNEKEVSDATRDFIQRFATVKANRLQHAVNAYKQSTSDFEFPANESQSQSQGLSQRTRQGQDQEDLSNPPNTPFTSQSNISRDFSSHLIRSPNHRMTPTRSNLSLNLPSGANHFHKFRRGFELEPSPSEKSMTQINAYLSNTTMENLYGNAEASPPPQFILAPPQQLRRRSFPSLQEIKLKPRRGSTSTVRRNSVSVPSFKHKQMSSISEDREESDEKDNFSSATQVSLAPKATNRKGKDMWSTPSRNQMRRAVVNLIKAPPQVRCGRQNLCEGVPMPSPSMLRMATSASGGDLNNTGFRVAFPMPISPKLRLKSTVTGKNGDSAAGAKMSNDKFLEPPPFTTSVYELPPWPHIIKRWATEQPAVTFMP